MFRENLNELGKYRQDLKKIFDENPHLSFFKAAKFGLSADVFVTYTNPDKPHLFTDNGRRYRVKEKGLGKGAYGSVFKSTKKLGIEADASISCHDSSRAIKVFDFLEQENFKEWQITRQVASSSKSGLFQDEGKKKFFMTMPFYSGPNLQHRINAQKSQKASIKNLSGIQRLSLCQDLARELQALHEKGILHRDVKPENFIAGNVSKIFDFGMSSSSSLKDIYADQISGSPSYLAPEIIKDGNKAASIKSDIFSLALVMAQIYGAKPFKMIPSAWTAENFGLEWTLEDLLNIHNEKVVFHDLFLGLEDDKFSSVDKENFKSLLSEMVALEPDNRPSDIVARLDEIKLRYYQRQYQTVQEQQFLIDIHNLGLNLKQALKFCSFDSEGVKRIQEALKSVPNNIDRNHSVLLLKGLNIRAFDFNKIEHAYTLSFIFDDLYACFSAQLERFSNIARIIHANLEDEYGNMFIRDLILTALRCQPSSIDELVIATKHLKRDLDIIEQNLTASKYDTQNNSPQALVAFLGSEPVSTLDMIQQYVNFGIGMMKDIEAKHGVEEEQSGASLPLPWQNKSQALLFALNVLNNQEMNFRVSPSSYK